MPVKLIAFDLDGTFLNSQKQVSERNLAAVVAATEKGILTVPASGRFYPGIPDCLKGKFSKYFILGNGAAVYDSVKGEKLISHDIPLDEVMRIFDYADSAGCFYDCYVDDQVYISQGIYDVLPELINDPVFLHIMYSLRKTVPDLRSWLLEKGRPVQKILLFFPDPKVRLRELKLMPEVFPEYTISSGLFCNIEVNNKKAEKGTALLSICEMEGIDPADAMVFGDNYNDLSMFREAGFRVAMSNAEEDVKAVASYITASCDEDGVAQAIEKFVL